MAFRPCQASDRCTCFDHASSRTTAWKRSPRRTKIGGPKLAETGGKKNRREMAGQWRIVGFRVASCQPEIKSCTSG